MLELDSCPSTPARTSCFSCGAVLPLWFGTAETIYDVDADRSAHEAWLDTPCQQCGKTPRQVGIGQ